MTNEITDEEHIAFCVFLVYPADLEKKERKSEDSSTTITNRVQQSFSCRNYQLVVLQDTSHSVYILLAGVIEIAILTQ